MYKRKTFSLGPATLAQLEALKELYGSESQAVAIALDRLFQAHAGVAPQPSDITHYNRVTLAAPAACAECGQVLAAGAEAYQPVGRAGPFPEFVCPECWAA